MSSKQEEDKNPSDLPRRLFVKRAAFGVGAAAALPIVAVGCGSSDDAAAADTTSGLPSAQAWKFGVMADTQWIATNAGDDGMNPHSCAVEIARQIQLAFINEGVKFVVQVGDLCDKGNHNPSSSSTSFTLKFADGTSYQSGSLLAEDTRALFVQGLYNAGIGFFPLRGNHDESAANAVEFQRLYPQTQNGAHNATPSDVLSLVNPDSAKQPSPTLSGKSFTLGSNFDSPSTGLKGLSYSFDFSNARFVLLDQFEPTDSTNADGASYTPLYSDGSTHTDGSTHMNQVSAPWSATATADTTSTGYNRSMKTQQSWIDKKLAGKPSGGHAFVFSHKGLMTQNHRDVLFGPYPTEVFSPGQDAFIKSLSANKAPILFCGHDHMHDRSLVASTDGTASVMQVVGVSASNKFYIPTNDASGTSRLSNDQVYCGGTRQTELAQELNTIGYYIVTVDGSAVTVDFYSAPVYPTYSGGEYLISTVPTLNFTRRERFGYGLNGKSFAISQGASYSSVADTGPNGTRMTILAGSYGNQATDMNQRPFKTQVTTSWLTASNTVGDALLLQGLDYTLGSEQTDPYALSLSFDPTKVTSDQIKNGSVTLVTRDSSGKWVKAVNANSSGSGKFVSGAWNASYPLGTWGLDSGTNTVWAVINHCGHFAVATL